MKIKTLKSLFHFNKGDQAGILFLAATIISYLYVEIYYHPSNEMVFSFSSSEIKQVQQQIDSMKILALEERQHKIYPFNPNFITDYKAYTLGMTPEQFDKLKAFREKDQWVNSKHDFQRVTGVSDSLLEIISSYFKFPDWVSKP
ncbi:MAG: helix-hairpin-helix domain-containing protein, partial [Flavobacteriaceae bacterium]|nr:helix-hairpin-helix domain-containing protein [Flavobacteriaceae bacterium]